MIADNRAVAAVSPQKPAPDWFITSTRFREARAYAAAQGQYTPGAMKTRIAQLDVGISRHPALDGWKLEDRGAGRDLLRSDTVEGFVGPLDRSVGIKPFEWPNHGTSTAYVLIGDVAVQPAQGDPAPGGALPDARLVPYRISRSVISRRGQKLEDAIADAIDRGCQVVTVSHLVAFNDAGVDRAIANAYAHGVIVVAAAGSHVLPLRKSLSRLATSPMAVGAGACLDDDSPWRMAHGSPTLSILAPGRNIRTACMKKNIFSGRAKADFMWSDGSSFSAPLTAGAAALWLDHHGAALERYSEPWMRVEAFKHCLRTSARKAQNVPEDEKHVWGAGVLDVLALLKAELPDASVLKHATVRPA